MGGVFPADNKQVFSKYSRHPFGYIFKEVEGNEYEVIPGKFEHAVKQNKEQALLGLPPVWVADVQDKEITDKFEMESAIYGSSFIRLSCPVMRSTGAVSDEEDSWEISRIDTIFLNLANVVKIDCSR